MEASTSTASSTMTQLISFFLLVEHSRQSIPGHLEYCSWTPSVRIKAKGLSAPTRHVKRSWQTRQKYKSQSAYQAARGNYRRSPAEIDASEASSFLKNVRRALLLACLTAALVVALVLPWFSVLSASLHSLRPLPVLLPPLSSVPPWLA